MSSLLKFGFCLQLAVGAPVDQKQVQMIIDNSQVNPGIALLLVAIESSFDHDEPSPKNAVGLTQITSIGWKEIEAQCENPGDILNPADNVRSGTCLLNFYTKGRFVHEGLIIYNGGYRALNLLYSKGFKAMPKETQNYIKKFNRFSKRCYSER